MAALRESLHAHRHGNFGEAPRLASPPPGPGWTALPHVYRPRRPRASPLYRLLEDHFAEFSTVYDERFAHRYGYWRPVIAEVVEKYLACGILEHGFARVRCGACKHEYLLAFSCKCRYFCPSCHAKRLALWGLWLEETLLADVPHRLMVGPCYRAENRAIQGTINTRPGSGRRRSGGS
ncbi:MAG: transposase zinc-binding domain-containing protein [Acidobacteria bacterium]|nr:transposase zinc-binding domain-containing protein [Acidobacteriota bacterium]